jgi:hypothetical protein
MRELRYPSCFLHFTKVAILLVLGVDNRLDQVKNDDHDWDPEAPIEVIILKLVNW